MRQSRSPRRRGGVALRREFQEQLPPRFLHTNDRHALAVPHAHAVDGVERGKPARRAVGGAHIQRAPLEPHGVVRDPRIEILRLRAVADDEGPSPLHGPDINIIIRGRTDARRLDRDRWLPIQGR